MIMFLDELELKNFRNYDSLKIKLSPSINIIYGNNAQGKTNLLESIYVLGLTRSHRVNIDNNLLKDNIDVGKIMGIVKQNKIKRKLEITLYEKNKILKIDKEEIKKVSDYILSSLNIIIFYPEDLEIIKGAPINRRNFINLELSQLSDNYLKILLEYNKLLKIRNDYLKKMAKRIPIDNNYFDIITQYMIDKMLIIYKMRKKFIDAVNENCSKVFASIAKLNSFSIKYKSNIVNDQDEDIKTNLMKRFKKNLAKEIKIGSTLLGIHRDDLEFYLGDKNLKDYGSQGQQRLAILSMKLSEIAIFKKYKNANPILLLDDVFSELDDIKKNNMIKLIGEDIQTIITTTDLKKINKKNFNQAKIFKIKDGQVIKIEEVDRNGK